MRCILISVFLSFATNNIVANADPYFFANNYFYSTSNKNKVSYNYFSKLLIYPLYVDKSLNINNGGSHKFKVEVYTEKMKRIMGLNVLLYCDSSLNVESFDKGKYIIKVSTDFEEHQFEFQKN